MKPTLIPYTFPSVTPGGLHSQGFNTGAAEVCRGAEAGEDIVSIDIHSRAGARYNSSFGPRSAGSNILLPKDRVEYSCFRMDKKECGNFPHFSLE